MTVAIASPILRSPCCRVPLDVPGGSGARCGACGCDYAAHGYGLDLMARQLAALEPAVAEWTAVQQALARWRQRTWTGSADAEDRTRANRQMAGAFLEFAGVAGDVLDAGCGNGWLHELVESRGGRYTGIDPHPIEDHYPFPFYRALSDVLPFADAAFDTVMFFSSFDYCLDPPTTIGEAARVLRPGGRIAIATPIHAAREAQGERLHNHRFLAGDVEALLASCFAVTGTHAYRDNYHFIRAVRRS
jgi:SAM-dependent methyltransferase